MSYTQSAGVNGVDAFMTFFKNAVSSAGWTHFAMNTSSLHCNTGLIGRQDVFRINGTTADPTKTYVTAFRNTQGNCCDDRVQFLAFSGCKGFDNPILIQHITRSAATNTNVIVTTQNPHNLASGDHIMLNGTPHSATFHEGWNQDVGLGGRGGFIIQSLGTASFQYTTGITSIADQAFSGYVLAVYNPAGTFNPGVNSGVGLTLNDTYMAVFMYYDEHRACGLVTQGASVQAFYVGETARDHIPPDFSGRALLLTNTPAGAVTCSLDRDSENIRAGQKIWFIHPSGSAGTGSFERTTVTSKPTSSSFGCTLVNAYPSGTLVGDDPMPCLILGNNGTNADTSLLSGKTIRFIFHLDATRDPVTPNQGQTMTVLTDSGVLESVVDPDSAGYYQGRSLFFQRTTAPSGIRGRLVGWSSFPSDAQNDQDIMRCGDSVEDDYKVFISQGTDAAENILGLGPGAT